VPASQARATLQRPPRLREHFRDARREAGRQVLAVERRLDDRTRALPKIPSSTTVFSVRTIVTRYSLRTNFVSLSLGLSIRRNGPAEFAFGFFIRGQVRNDARTRQGRNVAARFASDGMVAPPQVRGPKTEVRSKAEARTPSATRVPAPCSRTGSPAPAGRDVAAALQQAVVAVVAEFSFRTCPGFRAAGLGEQAGPRTRYAGGSRPSDPPQVDVRPRRSGLKPAKDAAVAGSWRWLRGRAAHPRRSRNQTCRQARSPRPG
jgi:hypothetical protein